MDRWYPVACPPMPTSPFAEEHETLRATVRRLVDDRLAGLATAAEHGAPVHGEVLELCSDALGLGDPLADVVVAEELGRLRSGGLVALLLDAALLADLGVDPTHAAVAHRGELVVSGVTARGHLPMVVGGALAQRVLVLGAQVVIEVPPAGRAAPAREPHGLRGGGLADVTLELAPCRAVEIDDELLRRAELREAAAAVAGAWQTFDDARRYAGERTAFGRPIGTFQVNRHALAELATWLTAAEALVHDAAWALASRGGATARDTAAARLFAGRTARQVADMSLQLHGGYGYTMDFDVQRAWRDARALALGDTARRTRVLSGTGDGR